jgi:hypothetical protein
VESINSRPKVSARDYKRKSAIFAGLYMKREEKAFPAKAQRRKEKHARSECHSISLLSSLRLCDFAGVLSF